jgi:hypothetical protein
MIGSPLPHRSKESTQTKSDTLVFQVGGWVDGPAPHHPTKNTCAKKNLDKGSEKRTVYLLTDIKLEKFNELRHMECSNHPRKNGGNNVRVRKTKIGCNRNNTNKTKGHRYGNNKGLCSSL